MSTFKRFHQTGIDLSLAQYVSNVTAHLPIMMREDIDFKVGLRKLRSNASDRNLAVFAEDRARHAEKLAHHFTRLFPFGMVNHEPKPLELTHDILMSDENCKDFAMSLTGAFEEIARRVDREEKERLIDTEETTHTDCLGAFTRIYDEIKQLLLNAYIEPPALDISGIGEKLTIEDALDILETAIYRCVDPKFIVRKLKRMRKQYIEHAQVTIGNVGSRKGQHPYVSRITLSNYKQQMRESEEFMQNMVVISHETMQEYNLAEVANRTIANLDNRRAELVVRTRGDEERAIDMGFEGVFITWTLPSKYHRSSRKWNGCTAKEAHQNLMEQWKLARAHFAKADIPWFGLRVAEPHEDNTPHLHAFIYCPSERKVEVMRICATIARSEDADELNSKKARKARFHAKPCDPSKGTATGYIIKYISKNINGAHLPEPDAENNSVSVRSWASSWGIRQFSQSGAPAVGIWRQLRRATKKDTDFDPDLEALRDHADNSRWKGFCQSIGEARLAYEFQQNQYKETVKRVIGLEWLGKVIETCSERFSLVAKSDVEAWKQKRGGASSWSTENKCNHPTEIPISPLERALMEATGWSVKGVQCLIKPLSLGAKIPIDKYTTLSVRNGRLITT